MEHPSIVVDVITRTRDRLPLLERALLSLRAQTYSNWRLFLVNDGGDQAAISALVATLKLDPDRVKILHDAPTNGHPHGEQLNFAAAKGSGAFIAVLDDTNWWPESFLAEMLAAVGDKSAVCCRSYCSRTLIENGRLEVRGRELYSPWWNGIITPWRLLESPIFEPPSFVIRRQSWEKFRFSGSTRILEVYELAGRLGFREEIAFCESTSADFSVLNDCPSGVDWGLVREYEKHRYVELLRVKAEWVRRAANEGDALFGNLVTQSLHQNQIYAKLDGLERVVTLGVGNFSRSHLSAETEIKKEKPSVEIAFALDERFLFPFAVALQSLSQNYRSPEALVINVLACGTLAANSAPLEKSFSRDPRFRYKIHSVSSMDLSNLRTDYHFSPSNYARLLIPNLPIEADHCVYFDCDIFFLGCISSLIEQARHVNVLAAAKDYLASFGHPGLYLPDLSNFGIHGNDAHFNSGVLVINLGIWRKERLVEKCFGLARRHPELTSLCDQHLINVQLHGRIQELDPEWNYQMADYQRRSSAFSEVHDNPLRWPKVLHFTTALKPWAMGYDLPWIHLYRETAQETARQTGLSLPEAL